MLQASDPDTAGDMRALAAAARRKLATSSGSATDRSGREPYDPVRIYARMAKYYGWSMRDMEQMHFPLFFAMVREASEMNEEEKAEYDRKRRSQGTAEPEQVQGLFPEAQEYTGETIRLS
jgi:hypothetical protein